MSTEFKQYTALRDIAIDNGADVSGVDGYALERFIQVCKLLIEAIGGTFEGLQGTLEQRKANALHQLALANGSAPQLTGTARERQIQSVITILQDNGIEFEVPQAAQDWRLLALIKLLEFYAPADKDQLITWSTHPYDGNEVTDAVSPLVLSAPATYGNCNCLLMAGAESIEIVGLTASNVITLGYGSTATPTAGTDTITFTAGIVSGIYIDGVLFYWCADGEGSTLRSLNKTIWPDATIQDATLDPTYSVRSTAEVTPWNLGGSTPYNSFDGVGDTVNTEIVPDDDNIVWDMAFCFEEVANTFMGKWDNDGGGRFAFGIRDGVWFAARGNTSVSGTTPADTEWHYFVYSPTIGLSVDGVLVVDLSSTSGTVVGSTEAIHIASLGGLGFYHKGRCAISRIWCDGVSCNQALTPSLSQQGAMKDQDGTIYENEAGTDLPLGMIPADPNNEGYDVTGGELQYDSQNIGAFEGYMIHSDVLMQREPFYVDGAFVPLYYADMLAAVPFADEQVLRWKKSAAGNCQPIDWTVYPTTYEWTEAGYNKTEKWRTEETDECGAPALVPLTGTGGEVLTGTGGTIILTNP